MMDIHYDAVRMSSEPVDEDLTIGAVGIYRDYSTSYIIQKEDAAQRTI
jgi:hypothetical protein